VYEARTVHRLDRRADRLAMMIASSRQAEQTVDIRRRNTNLDGRSLAVKQMEVETLAAEIQTGVQHRNGPPLDSSQSTSWSVSLGRPFFMAFLTIEVWSGKRGQGREWAPTKAAQEEGNDRKRLTACARLCPRWCSLSVPSPPGLI
jgi:hypothetical protein